jgi:hypothetical protein
MTESLALIPSSVESQLNRNAAFRELREMVLNSVMSEHSKRNYAKALDEIFALCEERKQPLSRALLMEYLSHKTSHDVNCSHLTPSHCGTKHLGWKGYSSMQSTMQQTYIHTMCDQLLRNKNRAGLGGRPCSSSCALGRALAYVIFSSLRSPMSARRWKAPASFSITTPSRSTAFRYHQP